MQFRTEQVRAGLVHYSPRYVLLPPDGTDGIWDVEEHEFLGDGLHGREKGLGASRIAFHESGDYHAPYLADGVRETEDPGLGRDSEFRRTAEFASADHVIEQLGFGILHHGVVDGTGDRCVGYEGVNPLFHLGQVSRGILPDVDRVDGVLAQPDDLPGFRKCQLSSFLFLGKCLRNFAERILRSHDRQSS